jgi:xylulokinase
MLTAGGALRWLKDALYENMEGIAYESDTIFEHMGIKASNVPAGSEGLFFLPYLNGERCPHNDPDARGAFVGLNLRHGNAHFIRSVLEGAAFGLRDLSEVITELGMSAERIVVSGRGANSNLWRQIMADILNKDVYTMNIAAYGAALIAGVGVGTWTSMEEAAGDMKVKTENHPSNERVLRYHSLFPVYRQLYSSLRGSFKKISEGEKI